MDILARPSPVPDLGHRQIDQVLGILFSQFSFSATQSTSPSKTDKSMPTSSNTKEDLQQFIVDAIPKYSKTTDDVKVTKQRRKVSRTKTVGTDKDVRRRQKDAPIQPKVCLCNNLSIRLEPESQHQNWFEPAKSSCHTQYGRSDHILPDQRTQTLCRSKSKDRSVKP